jgi:hypothetical protein
MRSAAALLPFIVAGCASQATTDASLPLEPCSVTDCFLERDVRDFDIVDRDTVVVYVGAQRCPFVVELQDVACDLRVAPGIDFFQTALGSMDRLTPVQSGRVCATTRGLVLYAGISSPSLLQQQDAFGSRLGVGGRPGDLSRPGVYDGSFPVDRTSGDVCRVSDIRSVTDDQLVELLADVNRPPPPIGDGRLEVPEEGELRPADADEAEAESSGAAEAESSGSAEAESSDAAEAVELGDDED